MADDLRNTKERLISTINEAGLETFLGAYPSESVSEICWNSDLEPDPCNFVVLAKSLGAKIMYINWVVFSEDELTEATAPEPVEDHPVDHEDLSVDEQGDRLKEFTQYVGRVASVRAGFFLDGVFHVFEREAEWYQEFGKLIAAEESDERLQRGLESGHKSKLSKEVVAWAEKLASDPRFETLDDEDQQCYLLRKLAGDQFENLPVGAIVKNAAIIYEVDIRPGKEEREEKELLNQIQTLKSQGKSILAIAGKLGLPRDRVSMLLAKLEG